MKFLTSRAPSYVQALCLSLGCALVVPQSATAQQVTRDLQTETLYEGSRVRVNLSGNLRYLSESIGSGACVLSAGWATTAATERMAATQAEFDSVLNALLFGNVNLGVPYGERASRVRTTLRDLLKSWIPTSVNSIQLLANTADKDLSKSIALNGAALEAKTQNLTDEILGEYVSRSDLLVADAFTASIASRQLKLLRQIEKLTCGTLSEQPHFGDADTLAQKMERFEVTLNALSTGMPNTGVMAPPTDELAQLLASIQQDWTAQKERLTSQLASGGGDKDAWNGLQDGFDKIFNGSLQAVSLYSRAAEGSEDATQRAILNFAENELTRWMKYREFIDAFRDGEEQHSQWLLDLLVKSSRGLVIDAVLINSDGSKIVGTEGAIEMLPSIAESEAVSTVMSEPVWDPDLQVFRTQIRVGAEGGTSGALIANVNVLPFM